MNRLVAGALLATLVAVSVIMGYLILRPTNVIPIVISGVTLEVELAKTPADQQRGLSGRNSLPPDQGMLFIFDKEGLWSFWMNDMRFSLDIIWFDSGRKTVFMEQYLQPCDSQYCPVFTPTVPAMYVLEVNSGFVQAHNITLGATFAFLD